MSKNQFTGTATQPQRNRKFCQFNKDQYCMQIYKLISRVYKILNLCNADAGVTVIALHILRIVELKMYAYFVCRDLIYSHHGFIRQFPDVNELTVRKQKST